MRALETKRLAVGAFDPDRVQDPGEQPLGDVLGRPAWHERGQAALARPVPQRAIAPAARNFALAFPSAGVRWLELPDAPSATLAVGWHPDNRNSAAAAFVDMARVFTNQDKDSVLALQ